MRRELLLIPVLAMMFETGCMVLPVPHRRLQEYGVRGKVLTPEGHPIPTAVVSVSGVSKKVADDGCYRFSPKFSWHGAVLIGPVSQSLLPHLDAVCLFGAVVDADAAGYCPRHVLLLPGSWPPEYIKFPGGDIIENTDKGNYLEYNIVLQPARKDRNDSITRDRDVQPPAGGD